MKKQTNGGMAGVVNELIQNTTQPDPQSFRELAKRVGAVYTISYSTAVIAVFDHDREQAGGLPKGGFLMAAKHSHETDESFILLRIQREARLPSAADNDQTRQGVIEDSGNEGPWSARMPSWIRDKMSLHGLECSVLGTFTPQQDGSYKFAEDIDNYYAVNELMVWKPDPSSLHLIVNHQHRSNDIPINSATTKIGVSRFAAAESNDAIKAEFHVNPIDIMKRRTAYFGMSRSGKSNGLKIVAETIYKLRKVNPKHRVGQVIFDLSGEYAQDNFQDGKGLHRVNEVLGLSRKSEVATYGLMPVPWDCSRKIMKLNFFGDPIPRPWMTVQEAEAVTNALDQLLAGKEIIKETMSNETARYTTSFRDVDLAVEPSAMGNLSAQTRYYRAVLAYRTALAAAGLEAPNWKPSIRGPGKWSLFSRDLIDALRHTQNSSSANATDYQQAAIILEDSGNNQFNITWDQLITVFTSLAKFVDDKKSRFDTFEQDYIATSSNHEAWADPRFRAVLRIFESRNGPRAFQVVQEQHDPNNTTDFAEEVVGDLQQGKLVIIDQSAGEPEHNRAAAERVMWHIYHAQSANFRSAVASLDPTQEPNPDEATQGHIIVYVEEAHNLLPRAGANDSLTTVWAKTAKEGSKLNIGLVLATQAPSSVMPEILSETDNWVLAYLNSERERRVVSEYMDFSDFSEQIGKVSEQGFVRIRTLSQAYTVPVQLDRFHIKDDAESIDTR
ncbi:MAG: ATP-binding protein [Gammaproteobacteria bacterium]|nr:ATP-binding protein [Gammaproteobacteria bacterium]MYD79164.1 ATP-binding protein [Gammaproteobacteria bacterium]